MTAGLMCGVAVGLIAIAVMLTHNSNLPHAKLRRFLATKLDDQSQATFHFAFPSVAYDFLARFYYRHLCQQMRDMGLPYLDP